MNTRNHITKWNVLVIIFQKKLQNLNKIVTEKRPPQHQLNYTFCAVFNYYFLFLVNTHPQGDKDVY